jgi:hypothetical protein
MPIIGASARDGPVGDCIGDRSDYKCCQEPYLLCCRFDSRRNGLSSLEVKAVRIDQVILDA